MRALLQISTAWLLTACAHTPSPPASHVTPEVSALPSKAAVATVAPVETALLPIDFAAHGLANDGCFLLHDLSSNSEQASSVERCAQGRRPNSTFKIVNTLIGADLGLLTTPDTIMVWDQAHYPAQPGWFDGWAQDQPLREAMRISAVPLFRKLAFDIGEERMKQYLEKLDYGNRDMSAGVDIFWLKGDLRISAAEQVALITKLVRDELPVSKQAQALVREVLKKDPIAGAPHAGKTGSGGLEVPNEQLGPDAMVGWMVGYIELARGPVAYAMWVEAPTYVAMNELRVRTLEGVLGEVVHSWGSTP